MTDNTLLTVRGLSLEVARTGHRVVKDVSFDIAAGEIFGIVGESGSGKTLATRALISLLPPAIAVTGGSIVYKGQDVMSLPVKALRNLRGAEIGVVFQEPMTSLNPSMTIGRQLEEGLILHTKQSGEERRARILDMLSRVGIRDPEGALTAYPHEFSGGMRQRIMLASVMLLKPALLIADEPTTALDAVIQRDVMELMVELTRAEGTAVLLISHDLPMVARYTRRIVVMEKGAIVEQGRTEDLLDAPQHPYTKKLLSSLPFRGEPRRIDTSKAPMVSARDIVVDYAGRKSLLKKAKHKRALHGVSIDIHEGEVVALVGGSGSGKTTLGRTIAGLVKESEGHIRFQGRERNEDWKDYRLNCQMVFQDPYSSLDPRMTIQALVEEALRLVPDLDQAAKRKRALETLEEVGLGADYAARYPHELSGGQRQRVAIARALIADPQVLLLDEPTSALDVSVQAEILNLLQDLRAARNLTYILVSHNLAVIAHLCPQVGVMLNGEMVEQLSAGDLREGRTKHPHTEELRSLSIRLEEPA